jgi:hypothetical protein
MRVGACSCMARERLAKNLVSNASCSPPLDFPLIRTGRYSVCGESVVSLDKALGLIPSVAAMEVVASEADLLEIDREATGSPKG